MTETTECVVALTPENCPVDWMRARLPADAVSVTIALPPIRREVQAWLSDPRVCIYFVPAILRRTPTNNPAYDEWWSGLPGSYIDLRQHGWKVSHWREL